MTTAPRRWVGVALAGLVGVAALGVVLVLSHAANQETAAVAPKTATQAAPTPTTAAAPVPVAVAAPRTANAASAEMVPTIDDVLAAQGSLEPGTIDTLVAALASTDSVVVAEAANGLVARGALSALPALVDIDIVARPYAAPSAIYAMGRLAAKAEGEERNAVVERLLALLASEKQRPSNEALANLLHIYEALGQTGDARAITALEAELVDARVATAPKVVIVQSLVALGARQSRPTLERVRDQLVATSTGDDLEAALQRDLLTAIREALVQLT